MIGAHDLLTDLRVFFGHQSVGDNVIEGVREIVEPGVIAHWPILGPSDAEKRRGGCLVHERLGSNGDPRSKTEGFCNFIVREAGARWDVALHKYCYVDVDASTDVAALFAEYRHRMASLRRQRPDIRLVHVTVPLVRVRTGPRAWVRTALRVASPRVSDNRRREEFNDLLRAHYHGREPVFDLAAIESGPRTRTRALRPHYTDDGGHLNEAGRRRAAGAFLELLSRLAEDRRRARSAGQRPAATAHPR